jgi:diguanylate cyclase (GGDEF)-like protein
MTPRYHWLALYSLLLATATAGWLVAVLDEAAFPPWWVVGILVACCLLVWQFGVPVPRVGLSSMERVPQIGMLLVLDPPVAAAICATASLLWPLISRRYSHGSARAAVLRAVHNAAMTGLMLLLAGEVYLAAGGRHPLGVPTLRDIGPLGAMALTAQIVNVALLATYFRLDGREVRRIIRPVYTLVDLVFVPAGVLAAVLYNTAAPATFALFVVLMALFVLSFSGFGNALSAADTEGGALARLAGPARTLRGARRIDELGERILKEVRTLFRFDEFWLAMVDTERGTLELRVQERHGERQSARLRPPLDHGPLGWAARYGEAVLVENWQRAPESLLAAAIAAGVGEGAMIIVPLRDDDGRVIAVLGVRHARPGAYSDADLNLMQRLAQQLAPAVADARAFEDLEDYRRHLEHRVTERTRELDRANQEKERLIDALGERSRRLERESQEDPLTAIANRRAFARRLEAEIEVARAMNQPLTLAVADLDHFKIVNDRMGHRVGDEVLRSSATLMQRQCRPVDLVARIGGEEFALILPGLDHVAAMTFCEELRGLIESYPWPAVHPGLRVTMSIGIAQWDGTCGADELVHAADTRLYSAKHAGRNRVA